MNGCHPGRIGDKASIAVVIVATIGLAGCLNFTPEVSNGTADTIVIDRTPPNYGPDGPPERVSTDGRLYAIIYGNRTDELFRIIDNEGFVEPAEYELYVQVIDKDGDRWVADYKIPELEPGAHHFAQYTYPDVEFPVVMVTSRMVNGIWLENPGASWDIAGGNHTFVEEVEREFELRTLPDLPDGEAVVLEHEFEFDPAMIHWGYDWAFNFNGEVELITPSDRQLVWWRGDGHKPAGAGSNNWSHPYESGEWTLRMTGSGWFKFYLTEWILPDDAWAHYGMRPPDAPIMNGGDMRDCASDCFA